MSPADRAAVFLDRDGTLIEDVGYPRDPGTVRLLPGAAQALKELDRRGFLLVLVSNQSGVGRGLVTPDEAAAVAARFLDLLGAQGVRLHGCYYCPHAPQAHCACRKPSDGMLRRASLELGIALERSFLVGDKASDTEAGKRAGCCTIRYTRLAGGASGPLPDYEASTWGEVLARIIERAGAAP